MGNGGAGQLRWGEAPKQPRRLREMYGACCHCIKSKLINLPSRWLIAHHVCGPSFPAAVKQSNELHNAGPNGSDYAAAIITAEILSQATSDKSADQSVL
jgi:hypothetical protein